MRASSRALMWLTWAQVLLLPLPGYALELWLARQQLAFDPLGRTVETFGVGAGRWLLAAAAIGVAWLVPRLWNRRATARLRARARPEIDTGREGRYRAAPPRVQRWASEQAAIEMAGARHAARLSATLAMLASLELAVFFRIMPPMSFLPCVGPGTAYVPGDEHLLLLGLIVLVIALDAPSGSAIVRPIRDLLEPGVLGGPRQPTSSTSLPRA